jgi:hypothetical protein
MPEIVEALNPQPDKMATRVNKANYDAYRAALLQVIPRTRDGVLFGNLADLVSPKLPAAIAASTKPMWWVTTVKLDLEARGLIERVPKASPQRLRRV